MATRPPKTSSGGGQGAAKNQASGGGGGSSSLVPRAMTITHNDPENLHHLLSDDQLDAFNDLAHDTSRDWFFTLFAAALATSQNVWFFLSDLYNKRTPTLWDGLMLIVFAVCVAGTILKGREFTNKRPKLEQKLAQIRSRRKVTINTDQIR